MSDTKSKQEKKKQQQQCFIFVIQEKKTTLCFCCGIWKIKRQFKYDKAWYDWDPSMSDMMMAGVTKCVIVPQRLPSVLLHVVFRPFALVRGQIQRCRERSQSGLAWVFCRPSSRYLMHQLKTELLLILLRRTNDYLKIFLQTKINSMWLCTVINMRRIWERISLL